MAGKDTKTYQMLPIIDKPEHVSLHFQSVTTQKSGINQIWQTDNQKEVS